MPVLRGGDQGRGAGLQALQSRPQDSQAADRGKPAPDRDHRRPAARAGPPEGGGDAAQIAGRVLGEAPRGLHRAADPAVAHRACPADRQARRQPADHAHRCNGHSVAVRLCPRLAGPSRLANGGGHRHRYRRSRGHRLHRRHPVRAGEPAGVARDRGIRGEHRARVPHRKYPGDDGEKHPVQASRCPQAAERGGDAPRHRDGPACRQARAAPARREVRRPRYRVR